MPGVRFGSGKMCGYRTGDVYSGCYSRLIRRLLQYGGGDERFLVVTVSGQLMWVYNCSANGSTLGRECVARGLVREQGRTVYVETRM